MKKIPIFILVFLCCFYSFSQSSSAIVSPCLDNGDFDHIDTLSQCSIGPVSSCRTFGLGCLRNWMRSHGTPQLVQPNTSVPQNNYIYMWHHRATGSGVVGEGVIGGYSFIAHNSYTVTIRYMLYPNSLTPSATGTLWIYAAKGMSQGVNTNNCGDPIPTVISSNKELIGFPTTITGPTNWQTLTFSFTPNQSFSQVWIYPQVNLVTGSQDLQIDATVDYITICPDNCNSSIFYSVINNPVPTGETRAAYIYADYTQNVASGSTSFIAGVSVFLEPEFVASVTGSGIFDAYIDPCTSAQSRVSAGAIGRSGIDLSIDRNINPLSYNHDDFSSSARNKEVVTDNRRSTVSGNPNPTNGIVILKFKVANAGQTTVRVLNALGLPVKQYQLYAREFEERQLEVNLKNLANSFYIVQVIDSKGIITTKQLQKVK